MTGGKVGWKEDVPQEELVQTSPPSSPTDKQARRASTKWTTKVKILSGSWHTSSGNSEKVQPYRAWCEQAVALQRPPRWMHLEAIGRAPLETPTRPPRLTPLRGFVEGSGEDSRPSTSGGGDPSSSLQASEMSGGGGGLAALDVQAANPEAITSGPSEDLDDAPSCGERPALQRSFSGQCTEIIFDQDSVDAFDAGRFYKACPLFAPCSPTFVRELLATGGPRVWRGVTFDTGTTVYAKGDAGFSAFIVARGSVEIVSEARVILEESIPSVLLGPGDVFGEPQVLGVASTRLETVHAKTSLHVLEVSCSVLSTLLLRTADSLEGAAPEPQPVEENEDDPLSVGIGGGATVVVPQDRTRHAFEEERRHFEHEAAKWYTQLRPRTGGTIAVPSSPRAANSSYMTSTEESSRDMSSTCRRSSRERNCTHGRGSSGGGGGGGTILSSTLSHNQESYAGPTVGVSSLEDPRKWRQQLKEAQAALMEGGSTGLGVHRERLLHRLRGDIRRDVRQGNMIPADAMRVDRVISMGGSSPKSARGGAPWESEDGGVSPSSASGGRGRTRSGQNGSQQQAAGPSAGHVAQKAKITAVGPEKMLVVMQMLRAHRQNKDGTEDDADLRAGGVIGERHALDLDLLPPLEHASPAQRQWLIKDLERQARIVNTRRRGAAIREGGLVMPDSPGRKGRTVSSRARQSVSPGGQESRALRPSESTHFDSLCLTVPNSPTCSLEIGPMMWPTPSMLATPKASPRKKRLGWEAAPCGA